MQQFRLLTEADANGLETYLARHADTTMFLRSNLRAAGLRYQGKTFEAEYVGHFADGHLVGVAAHAWNHNLLVQTDGEVGPLARATIEVSGRPVAGFLGPMDQVTAATASLGMADTPPMHCGNDDLYALDLTDLNVPSSLQNGMVRCRLSSPEDLDLLIAWRIAYCVEVLGDSHDATLEREAEELIQKLHDQRNLWVLERDGHRVAKSAFNARLPDCVQVGGVWTPPEERGRGFARAVVAGSLLDARDEGARRAILFTDNPAARKAYESIGFRKIGRYGFVLYSQPIPIRMDTADTASTRS